MGRATRGHGTRVLLACWTFIWACGGEAFEAGNPDSGDDVRATTGGGAGQGGSGSGGAGGGGSSAEGGPGMDAPPEAVVVADQVVPSDVVRDAPTSFCALAPHMFCCDFDRPDSLSGQWTAQTVYAGGVLSISSAQSTSPPSSLFVRTVRSDSGLSSQATLRKSFTTSPVTHAHLGFDIFSSVFTANGSSNAITFTSGQTNMTLALLERTGAVSCTLTVFGSGVATSSFPCAVIFPGNTWTHFDIDLTISTQLVQFQILCRGTTTSGQFQAGTWSGASALSIGSYPGSPDHVWEGYFDNVVVDYQ